MRLRKLIIASILTLVLTGAVYFYLAAAAEPKQIAETPFSYNIPSLPQLGEWETLETSQAANETLTLDANVEKNANIVPSKVSVLQLENIKTSNEASRLVSLFRSYYESRLTRQGWKSDKSKTTTEYNGTNIYSVESDGKLQILAIEHANLFKSKDTTECPCTLKFKVYEAGITKKE